jgi:hypothetical protein
MGQRRAYVQSALVMLAVVLASLWAAAPAMADSMTPLSSYSDPRGDFPNRPPADPVASCPGSNNCLMRGLYGPYTIPAASGSTPGQLHNLIDQSAPAPCTNCRITDIVPNLVDPSGNTVNLEQGLMLHHFVFINRERQDITCPSGLEGGLGERFFASGNERTDLHLPLNFGYENNTSSTWWMIYHLVNRNTAQKTVYLEVTFRTRPKALTQPATPAWLDIDNCGDSEYSIPTGYSDYHDPDNLPVGGPYSSDWTLPWDAHLLGIAGHLHDVDITSANPCTVHCAAEGGGRAVSAELLGGPSTDYFGPSPPNNDPPTDLGGATLCRSEAYYGTAFAGTAWSGHLDTMSHCGIFTDVPAGAQPESYPAAGAYAPDGYPVKKNQVIRLHSEYDNGTGAQQNDVMGIMVGWFAINNPYPRPGSGSPLRVPLVPAFAKCTSPNSTHAPPLSFGSCTPPALESGVLTTSTVGAGGGFARYDAIAGNPATVADEADVNIVASATDVRKQSDGTDYVGKLLLTTTIRVTDKQNGPAESGSVQDATLSVPISCLATPETVGSNCNVTTTADTLLPGFATESKRTLMSMLSVNLKDAGPNGTGYGAGCPPTCGDGDETVFMRQGVFAP